MTREECDADFGVRLETADSRSVAGPRVGLLATSLDNFVYCLSPQRGVRLWKYRLAGRVLARPLVLNESVLLTPLVGEEGVILSLQDGKKVNSVYVGEDNNTGASPLLSGNLILLTTRKGLLAFSNQAASAEAQD